MARFTAQQQRAAQIAAASAAQPAPMVTSVSLFPEGASGELKRFSHHTQADLYNRNAQLHNQQLSTASSSNQSQASSVNLPAAASGQDAYTQQNGPELQAQSQRFQTVAAQVPAQPLSMPPPLVIPANVSPALKTFLTQKDQLMREQIQLWNQYATASPAVRNAAIQQWQQQNAPRLNQLKQQAQNLVSTQN